MHPGQQPHPSPQGALGAGIYPAGEAARLAQLEPQRLRRWVAGYTFRGRAGERRSSSPVFKNEARHNGQHLVLSFLDLIEACFVKVFLDHGVSLHTIRLVAEDAVAMFKTTHPFCVKRFETDGETILARLRDERAEGGERLLDLKRRHFVFPAVFNPLLKTLDYDTSGDAVRWWPRGKETPVVLDPKRAFGAAIVERSCVPTRALFDAHLAGETQSGSASIWTRCAPPSRSRGRCVAPLRARDLLLRQQHRSSDPRGAARPSRRRRSHLRLRRARHHPR